MIFKIKGTKLEIIETKRVQEKIKSIVTMCLGLAALMYPIVEGLLSFLKSLGYQVHTNYVMITFSIIGVGFFSTGFSSTCFCSSNTTSSCSGASVICSPLP